MNPSIDLVNRLWRLCALLRKDGVTYQQYVTELTYLLFLKMASEQKDESRIPERYRWAALSSASETEVLQRYRQALIDLGDGTKIADRSVVAIFQNAATIVREPANLRKLIDAIDGLHWRVDESYLIDSRLPSWPKRSKANWYRRTQMTNQLVFC